RCQLHKVQLAQAWDEMESYRPLISFIGGELATLPVRLYPRGQIGPNRLALVQRRDTLLLIAEGVCEEAREGLCPYQNPPMQNFRVREARQCVCSYPIGWQGASCMVCAKR